MRLAAEVARVLDRSKAVLSFALGLVPLAVVPSFSEPFSDPKRVGVSLIAAFLALSGAGRSRPRWDAATALAALGFCAAAFGLFVHGVVFAALPELWLLLWVIAQYVTGETWIDERGFWWGSALAAALLSALVIFQVAGAPLGVLSAGAAHGKWRAFGTLGNPNRVAWYLAVALPGVAHALRARPRARVAALALALAAIALTLSRGAWVALAIVSGVAVVASGNRARRRRWLAGAALALVALAFSSVLLPADWRKFLLNWDSVQGRWRALADAWSYFRSNPAYGIGLGRFEVLSREARNPTGAFAVEHVHGEYLGILIEVGWAGLLSLLGCVALACARGARRAQGYARSAALCLALVAVLSLYDFPLREPSVLVLAAWALLRLRAAGDTSEARSTRLPGKWAWAIALAGLFVAYDQLVVLNPVARNWIYSSNSELREILKR